MSVIKVINFSKDTLITWLIPILIILFWQLAVQSGWLSTRIMPAPLDVLNAGITLAKSGELAHHFLTSLERAVLGLVIGGSIGFFLGFITGLSKVAQSLLDSTIQMIRNIPLLALMPLVVLWFGIGEVSKIFILSMAVFFPIYLNTVFLLVCSKKLKSKEELLKCYFK